MSGDREPTGDGEPTAGRMWFKRTGGVRRPATADPNEAEAAESGNPPALQFAILADLEAVGILGCGWLYDPQRRVREIRLGDSRDEPLDLLGAAALGLSPQLLCEAFAIEEPVEAERGFAFAIPKAAADWRAGLGFVLHLEGAPPLGGFAPAVGRAAQIDRLIDSAPVEIALGLAERAIAAWWRSDPAHDRLPAALDRLLDRIHRRIAAAAPAGAAIGEVLRIDGQGMLIGGRIAGFDRLAEPDADPIRELAALSLSGRRVPLAIPPVQRLTYVPPQDEAPGKEGCFAVFAPVEALRPAERHWLLEISRASGAVERVAFVCPPAVPPIAAIKAALGLVDPDVEERVRLFEAALSPAVDALWAAARREVPAPSEIRYGAPPAAPEVSVIVPLYGRIDLATHQIVQFCNDPEFRSHAALAELIYVLDDPRLEAAFERLCARANAIYQVPFRTLRMHRNAGFSGAVNAGAAAASGATLLLLNSDVMPKRARWLGQLLRIYRSLEGCGILGCRLLYEDGAIQHAGMRFARSREVPWAWENEHPGKGLPTRFDRHGTAPAQAVTGACLMIARDLYRRLGGLSEAYVLGDFEDSDLCLKAQAQAEGSAVYYTSEVELYHLERQSVQTMGALDWRRNLTFHNMLSYSRKWGETIARMQAPPPPGA